MSPGLRGSNAGWQAGVLLPATHPHPPLALRHAVLSLILLQLLYYASYVCVCVCVCVCERERERAVSYTHLDVYKRQGINRAMRDRELEEESWLDRDQRRLGIGRRRITL